MLPYVLTFLSCAAAAALSLPAAASVSIRFVPEHLPPPRAGDTFALAVVLRLESGDRSEAGVSLRAPEGVTVTPHSRTVRLKRGANVPVFFNVGFPAGVESTGEIHAVLDSDPCGTLEFGEQYDLSAVGWRAKTDTSKAAAAEGWAEPAYDDSGWQPESLPSMWSDLGVTYLRARVFVPESWKGRSVRLKLAAVDDNDVCYVNGVEIGRTDGWDKERDYPVDPAALKYGQENVLCIAVDNVAHGGGIYRSPNLFGIAPPASHEPVAPRLAPPGEIGRPMPLRKMLVENGVLRYQDGGEVALWGVNYYPQSWHQYDNMKRLGVDMKQAIREDLDDMLGMGAQVIRIHVFDREISDAQGNIIDNEHLDLLDYLVSEASARGLYLMFTPIAWWWSPNQNPDSFSNRTPKEYMFCDDEAIRAQAAYLSNWLNRTNRYTGKPYKDEPAICVLEILNEPAYADFNTVNDPNSSYYPGDLNLTGPFRERLRAKWRRWCESHGVEPEQTFFSLFRYYLMSAYLDAVYTAVRNTGARQPVAFALFDTTGQDDLISAIADSECEAVTTGSYAGAWDKVGDGVNYLPYTANARLDARLDSKARLVYEFDGIKTFGSYLYPAYARRFRSLGAQICCMFQYDSRTTAEWNTDWDAHYLNWLYTPGKAVSFWIGGRAFEQIPRGSMLPDTGDPQVFGACAVSFERNVSVYSFADSYACSAPWTGWDPIGAPNTPSFVMAVGDSPFAKYAGSGIYTLRVDYQRREAVLTVNPDADIVGDPWHPDPNRSAVVLRNRPRPFTLTIGGVQLASVARSGGADADRPEIEVEDNTFVVSEGEYLLKW